MSLFSKFNYRRYHLTPLRLLRKFFPSPHLSSTSQVAKCGSSCSSKGPKFQDKWASIKDPKSCFLQWGVWILSQISSNWLNDSKVSPKLPEQYDQCKIWSGLLAIHYKWEQGDSLAAQVRGTWSGSYSLVVLGSNDRSHLLPFLLCVMVTKINYVAWMALDLLRTQRLH